MGKFSWLHCLPLWAVTEHEQGQPPMAREIQAKKPRAACGEYGHNSRTERVDIILEERNS